MISEWYGKYMFLENVCHAFLSHYPHCQSAGRNCSIQTWQDGNNEWDYFQKYIYFLHRFSHNTGRSPAVNIVSIALRSDMSMPAWWYPTPYSTRSLKIKRNSRQLFNTVCVLAIWCTCNTSELAVPNRIGHLLKTVLVCRIHDKTGLFYKYTSSLLCTLPCGTKLK